MASTKIQYVLTGFKQDLGFRIFAFNGVGPDRKLTPFVVRAELTLAQRYGIRLQELPLLCRGVLEQREDDDGERAYTFTEEQMQSHASVSAAKREAAQQKRTPFRRPQSGAASA
ncbi:MAG: hypothetical protein JNL98_19820 [Bryobacterales bacterium]|nr:hypothetical protein [Bryobacterales bacterium]